MSGRHCVLVGLSPDPKKMSGSAPPDRCALKTALIAAIRAAGCAHFKYISAIEATEESNLSGYDTLFICSQATSLRRHNEKKVWESNVLTTRNICEAAESAGIKRIVLLGSILSLGHSPENAPVDATTPYLSDDRRGVFEKSLYWQEMQVWQMAERGLSVSVVCGGIMAEHGWATELDPEKYAHLMTTPHALVQALTVAAYAKMAGKRLICTGLSEALAKKMKKDWERRGDSLFVKLAGMLGLTEVAKARKILAKSGIYASDFPAAEE